MTGDKAKVRGEGSVSHDVHVTANQQGRDASRQKMNKLERRYMQYLEALKFSGEIRDFRFEPFRLKLAEKCTYCPDFFIVTKDGAFEVGLQKCLGIVNFLKPGKRKPTNQW